MGRCGITGPNQSRKVPPYHRCRRPSRGGRDDANAAQVATHNPNKEEPTMHNAKDAEADHRTKSPSCYPR